MGTCVSSANAASSRSKYRTSRAKSADPLSDTISILTSAAEKVAYLFSLFQNLDQSYIQGKPYTLSGTQNKDQISKTLAHLKDKTQELLLNKPFKHYPELDSHWLVPFETQ